MNDLLRQNYQAIVNRDLINDKTTRKDFIEKLIEELGEVVQATDINNFYEELADVINVCNNILIFEKQDPEHWMKKCLKKNNKRIMIRL